MQQFLSVNDTSNPTVLARQALQHKAAPLAYSHLGKGKTLGLIFLNPSFRTRLSTQLAARNLGMDVIVLNQNQDSWQLEWNDGAVMNGTTVEHVKDAAEILSLYCDVIGIRCFPGLTDKEQDYSEHILLQFKKYCSKPLISLESATRHPLQSLADIATILEHWSQPGAPRVVLCWAPHIKPLPQAVPNSFAEWVIASKMPLRIVHPEGYELDPAFTGNVKPEHDAREALQEADFIYFKNWSPLEPYGKPIPVPGPWSKTLLPEDTGAQSHYMHCLPVRRNLEVSDAILDHPNSLIYKQAQNRVFAAQAVLNNILNHA